jgi:hypothetical protein
MVANASSEIQFAINPQHPFSSILLICFLASRTKGIRKFWERTCCGFAAGINFTRILFLPLFFARFLVRIIIVILHRQELRYGSCPHIQHPSLHKSPGTS